MKKKRVKVLRIRRLPVLIASFLLLAFGITTYIITYSEFTSKFDGEESGVSGSVVYVNDAEADWYYYTAQNYTYNEGTLPTIDDKNIYGENNLVQVKIIYSGDDIANQNKGYVSSTELQDTFVYYKTLPVYDNGTESLDDDYVYFELIDNPFTNRPNNKGFNGWVTNYSGAVISYDNDYYLRYVRVPVTYDSGEPNTFEIRFYASWIDAYVGYVNGNSSWNNAFTPLKDKGLHPFYVYGPIYEPYDMTGYYTRVTIPRYSSCSGYYNNRGDIQNYCTCWTNGGCTYYDRIDGEYYDESNTYYQVVNRNMTEVDHDDIERVLIGYDFANGFDANTSLASFFRLVNIPRNTSLEGYYDEDGNALSGTCNTNGGCNYYELIQYYDDEGNIEVYSEDDEYYYLSSRDTNIIVMNGAVTGAWESENAKPFTLTGLFNGTLYNYTWTMTSYATCYDDTVIENLTINSNSASTYNSNPPSGRTTARTLYANGYNLKVGRGIKRSGNNDSFRFVVGYTGGSVGSQNETKKYKLTIESGFYSSFALGSGAKTSGHYTSYSEARATYGNDYDRVTKNNSNLILYFCASGAWGDNYYTRDYSEMMFDVVVKSGSFGTSQHDYTTGFYVGGRNGGTHNAARRIKVEGGDIYNINGGPLTATNRTTVNDTYIYMTGGEVDTIFGGAGLTTTYGNRIIQITGGTVNYSVFGGSNGSSGSEGDGKISGSTYLYIGGTAVIGNDDNVANGSTRFGAEAGSIFGIGNGRTGYSTIGSCDNSNIVIADKAHIKNSIYGGGNFGATGINSSQYNINSNIRIIGGTIDQNVYGGGNNNGTGASGKYALVDIRMTNGTVKGNVYGGSNEKGTVYGDTSVNVLGGTVEGSVYGGGKGGYEDRDNPGTFVTQKVDVTIGQVGVTDTPTIKNNVYGGSAYGSVNGATNSTNVSSYNTSVVVNNGKIEGSVFGGGEGSNTFTPYVMGNVTVTVNNGTINNVYGGNDTSGTPNGTINVYINNGNVNNTFGGGNLADVRTANVYLKGGNSTNVYGGGNLASIDTSHVYLDGGTSTNVYGGCNESSATTTNVTLQGSNVTNIFGGSNTSGDVTTSNVILNSGTSTNVYGGNNLGGSTATTNVNVNGGNVEVVYGGGRLAPTGTTNVKLSGSSPLNVYGGGEEADVTVGTNVTLQGSTVRENIYGGSNKNGTVQKSVVLANYGSVDTIFGGNNLGGTTLSTDVTVNWCTVNTVYGGGRLAPTGTTNVEMLGSNASNVYGGGESADVTESTYVLINGAYISGNVFGGSNTSGNVATTTIDALNGSAAYIYGGNNLGGYTEETNVNVNGIAVGTSIFGGGNQADSGTTNVVVDNINSYKITSVFGGGNAANVDVTNVTINGGSAESLYGGSNMSGEVGVSNLVVNGGTYDYVYGSNNQGGITQTTNVDINGGTIKKVYGGGNFGDAGTTNVTLTNATISEELFGGGNEAEVTGNVDVDVTNSTINGNVYGGGNFGEVGGSVDLYISGGTIGGNLYAAGNGETATVVGDVKLEAIEDSSVSGDIFGGGNQAAVNGDITIVFNDSEASKNFYGGGNFGAVDGSTDLTISNSSVGESLFAGGNGATAVVKGNTSLDANNVEVTNYVYGGGNQSSVIGDVSVKFIDSTTNDSLFGGGNNGEVGGSTDVYVSNSSIGDSLYAGGNGSTAIVKGSTLLNVDGTTTVTNHVFGGGNAAATGTEEENNSNSIVNIAGATIGKNVYGGANTSVLYGIVLLNIGQDVVTDSSLIPGDIKIGGTVFGGGEANASGSEVYDFTFISVTNGITINIDGNKHDVFDIGGSIFGSGNASTTEGYSYITIKNYGTKDDYKSNISIQRANLVTLDNSAIELSGATDRTNEYSDVLFTLSRIDELKLINSSTLYLQTGSNLLKKFTSAAMVDGNEVKAAVAISENGDVSRNVNNKVYMFEGKNLNIATDQKVTAYGEVSGMTFFGMYSHDREGKVYTALYNTDHENGDSIASSDMYYFNNGSYVLGLHHTNHDIEIDGFYTNYNNKDNSGVILVDYIDPTPEDANYYMWVVGEQVATYDITITASKYSTLGTYELPLINLSSSNTTFTVLGFNYNGLNSDVSLIDHTEIPRVAATKEEADNVMSLVMKTSNSGWITRGSTTFYTDDRYYQGTTDYVSENSTTLAPSLLFYLYHSKNLSEEGRMGTATISMIAVTPIDDLNNEVQRININVDLTRAVYSTNDYEGTITAGREYSMFAPSLVNITNKSSFTTYYALFAESETDFYKEGYHRVLASTYNFPANTKITMIDFLSGDRPEYFYYVVSEADHAALQEEYNLYGEVSYKLSNFVKMGSSSPNNNYDDAYYNDLYYNPNTGYSEEEFIFIVDFSEAGITEDVLNKQLVIELRNDENQIVTSVLGVQQEALVYNLYANKDAIIEVDGSLSSNNIYIGGDPVTLKVNTNFIQSYIASNVIMDTSYFDSKLGIMLTIYDSNGNVVNGTSLLGVTFTIGNVVYYPRIDGTTRINIAERVANVSSNIKINTNGSSLASGDYTIKIESFGSPDGIYFGLETSASTTLNFTVNNTIYGLNVSIDEKQLIIDKTTGYTENNNNVLVFNIEYSSGLKNPNLRVALYRRRYDEIYSNNFDLVNLADYVTNTLKPTNVANLYYFSESPIATMNWFMYTKEGLMSGTYKIVFSLYDGNTYIGDVYKYLFIK